MSLLEPERTISHRQPFPLYMRYGSRFWRNVAANAGSESAADCYDAQLEVIVLVRGQRYSSQILQLGIY